MVASLDKGLKGGFHFHAVELDYRLTLQVSLVAERVSVTAFTNHNPEGSHTITILAVWVEHVVVITTSAVKKHVADFLYYILPNFCRLDVVIYRNIYFDFHIGHFLVVILNLLQVLNCHLFLVLLVPSLDVEYLGILEVGV